MEASVTRPHQFRRGGLRTSPGSFGDGLVFPPPPRTTSFASPTWVTFIGRQAFFGALLSPFFKASSLLDFNDRSSLSLSMGSGPRFQIQYRPNTIGASQLACRQQFVKNGANTLFVNNSQVGQGPYSAQLLQ